MVSFGRSKRTAVAGISVHDEGNLCAPTAFGKTALAAWPIVKRKVNTLILVHRQQLLDQWQERLAMFLNMPAVSIGHAGQLWFSGLAGALADFPSMFSRAENALVSRSGVTESGRGMVNAGRFVRGSLVNRVGDT